MRIELSENEFTMLQNLSKNRILRFFAFFSAEIRRATLLLAGLQPEVKEDRRKFTSAENGKKGGRPRKKPKTSESELFDQ